MCVGVCRNIDTSRVSTSKSSRGVAKSRAHRRRRRRNRYHRAAAARFTFVARRPKTVWSPCRRTRRLVRKRSENRSLSLTLSLSPVW